MRVRPYPYVVRARWGETLVAESGACLCAEESGRESILWFPPEGIELSRFGAASTSQQLSPFGGAQQFAISALAEGTQRLLLAVLTAPSAEYSQLEGYGTFEDDTVLLEVLDPCGDGEGCSIKRFPTWGDTADLIELMNVHPDGPGLYRSEGRTDGRRPVVEASQMLGQAMVAAGRHAPDRRVVSAAMIFLRPADAALGLEFSFENLSTGRSFIGQQVHVLQGGRRCAAGTLLLDATAPDVVRHGTPMPDVPGPADCVPFDMSVTGRELRVVDAAYTNDPAAPLGPPSIDCWVRFRALPDDPPLHTGLLAQFTGHMSIAAALRPHPGVGQAEAHRTLSMGINAISLSLHQPVRADRWLLYHHLSTFAGDGMTHSECRVFDEAGSLVASFTVDAMIRLFNDGSFEHDARTAL
ncbi:MAG TPA: acyl-CoA thioesterase domain-containing protein [Acidimicrobiales bacterium]|jgi:acyl-CoA thioesterase II